MLVLFLVGAAAAMAGEMEYRDYSARASLLPAAKEEIVLLAEGDVALAQGKMHAFQADIPSPGRYIVSVVYTAAPGASAPVEAELKVDGAIPFRQAGALLFRRLFQNVPDSIARDEQGNDLRPLQQEAAISQHTYVRDAGGYTVEPFELALDAGSHQIALRATRGGLILHRVSLMPPEKILPYKMPAGESAKATLRIQGESAVYRSDASLLPVADRASALTEPNRGALITLNMIGGTAFKKPGSAITWVLDVPEGGVYELRLRARQNYSHSFFAMRTLYVDGAIPFVEAQAIPFHYDSGFQIFVPGGEVPHLLHLAKGRHTITLEATLGGQAEQLKRAQVVLSELNKLYTRILMLTGAGPDPLRDYGLETKMPDVIAQMAVWAGELRTLTGELTANAATAGGDMVAVDRLIRQLERFADAPYEIPEQFESFKTNLSALGEWIQAALERPLDIDYLELAVPGSPLPPAEAGFLENVAYQSQLFADSFKTDYASFGGGDSDRSITVWVTGSRDRAQLLYDLIRTDFTPRTSIAVDLQLVQGDFVTPLVSVGDGPDVLLGAAMADPVNYAARHAAMDLTGFEDYQETAGQFLPEAVKPFALEGGVYALPETMSFSMMFYRKDILSSLGIDPPDTWEDMVRLIPVLSRSNMLFLVDGRIGAEVYGSLTSLSMFLFQNGGQVYTEDGMASALDSETAVASFRQYTKLFTHYGMPYGFNTAARFRSGEAPIVICDYGLFNTLMVSAPEIAGLWAMAPVPGTAKASGEIDRSVRTVVTGNMILRGCKNPDAAWEFLKWCSQKETQVNYSRQLESLLGSAARYPAANLLALGELNWTEEDLRALKAQMEYAKAVPEVPGGYYTTWHVENAFRAVVLSSQDARESLLDYVRVINTEITAKRQELGLGANKGEDGK